MIRCPLDKIYTALRQSERGVRQEVVQKIVGAIGLVATWLIGILNPLVAVRVHAIDEAGKLTLDIKVALGDVPVGDTISPDVTAKARPVRTVLVEGRPAVLEAEPAAAAAVRMLFVGGRRGAGAGGGGIGAGTAGTFDGRCEPIGGPCISAR